MMRKPQWPHTRQQVCGELSCELEGKRKQSLPRLVLGLGDWIFSSLQVRTKEEECGSTGHRIKFIKALRIDSRWKAELNFTVSSSSCFIFHHCTQLPPF
jgi:hypothetical protein